LLPLRPPFRQVVLPAERTVPLPARLGRHLIGYQLSGENANTKNLITGTRYLNIQGMLPFENMVADYVKETGNHILYRSTPIFEGNNLLASGVLLEAYSVEDNGDGICFNVYCYNVQPDISIN
jgi:DNA-entry nuclease